MTVHVDEARRQRQAATIDTFHRIPARAIADARDAIADKGDIRCEARTTRPIKDERLFQDDVKHDSGFHISQACRLAETTLLLFSMRTTG
jgi:hypothetical protein